jgi:hypothetical protein
MHQSQFIAMMEELSSAKAVPIARHAGNTGGAMQSGIAFS